MEFEEGFKVTDLESIEKAGLNKKYVPMSHPAVLARFLDGKGPDVVGTCRISPSIHRPYALSFQIRIHVLFGRRDVARLVSSVFNSQVFQSGWVHCDPHPANVLIRPDRNGKPHMVLVDHGLYKAIDDDFRIEYAQLWKALMLADLKGIRESCHRLGVDEMVS